MEEAIHGIRSDPAEVVKKLQTAADRKLAAAYKKGVVKEGDPLPRAVDPTAGDSAGNSMVHMDPVETDVMMGNDDSPARDPAAIQPTRIQKEKVSAANKALGKLFSEQCDVVAEDVDELLEAMSDKQLRMFDEAEIKDAERTGIESDGSLSFKKLCKSMMLPLELQDAYAEWLSCDGCPGHIFNPSDIPRSKGGKIKAGLKIPRPAGALWRKLRDEAAYTHEHFPKLHEELKSYSTYNDGVEGHIQRPAVHAGCGGNTAE